MAYYEREHRPHGTGNGYVPSTRVGIDDPRRTKLGSQSRGANSRRGGRPVQGQRGNTRYRSDHNYRTLTGKDTGYSIHNARNHPRYINFEGRGGRFRPGLTTNRITLGVVMAILILIAAFAYACTRGSSQQGTQSDQEQQGTGNQWDARVSASASQDLTQRFSTQLDRNEKLATIAQNLDKYPDQRIPELALSEPDAMDFVAGYPTAESKASDFGQDNAKGSYPMLFDWDTRWAYVEYAGSVLGVTGSGPTALSMAYMGLTGKTDKTAAAFAADATDKGYTSTGNEGTTADLFTYEARQLGFKIKQYDPSADSITSLLATKGTVAIVRLKEGFDTSSAHWALIVKRNDDGSVTLYDPACSAASSHPWDVGSIAAGASDLYALSN